MKSGQLVAQTWWCKDCKECREDGPWQLYRTHVCSVDACKHDRVWPLQEQDLDNCQMNET